MPNKYFNDVIYIIMLILFLFIVLYFIYHGKDLNKLIYYDNTLDNRNHFKDLISISKKNASNKLKEKFTIDENLIIENDAINYNKQLDDYLQILDNTYYGENGLLNKIENQVKNANLNRIEEREKIINLLTNIYMSLYIDNIHKKQHEMYKTYLKYNDPKKNKYYSAYFK